MLIENYGFAPMGGLKLPNGKNILEIENLKSIEAMDLAEYQAFLESNNSEYAEIVKPLKLDEKENYNIRDNQHLIKTINTINQERLEEGKSRIWGVVYKITDPNTGFERVGETDDQKTFLLIDRIKGYINNAKKISQPNARLNAFEKNLADYFGFSQGVNLDKDTSSFIDEFFKGYDVKIWLCDNRLEMHALEDLVTLYTNRIDNDQGFDLRKNNFFNPIVGSLFEDMAMKEAYNLDKLTKHLLKDFERALPKELVYKKFVKEGIRISESTFDSYCEKLTGKTYYQAMNDRILKTSAIPSPLDAKTRSWLSNKFSKEKLNTLLWTRKGPDGNLNPLFLGYHISTVAGNGFIHSYIKYYERFREWFITPNVNHPIATCAQISNIIYNVVNKETPISLGYNKYRYYFIYNNDPKFFTITIDPKTGEINEIKPSE